MIIKLAGMITVLLSSALTGFYFADSMAQRERELCNLSDAISLMIGEVGYSHLCIKDIFFKVSSLVKGEASELFKLICTSLERGETAEDAWKSAVESASGIMALKNFDCEILTKSGYLFDAYSLDEQIANLEELKRRIENLACDALQYKKKNSRIVKMLGIYGGILLCIIVF